MNIFPEDIDLKSSKEIKAYQEEQLGQLLQYVNENSKFYSDLFKESNINFKDIKTIEDLQKLPFTTKDDLYEQNDDFICVDRRKIVDYITTSGTLGDPVTFAMTDADLERLAYNEYVSFKLTASLSVK